MLRWSMTVELRVMTEPQQGASYDDLLAVARTSEQLGFGAFFRSDHYLAMGGAGPARPDGRLDHAGRAGAGHLHDPARHADDERDVPPPRRARDPGRAGRRDEQRSGGAGHRCRLVHRGAHRLRHPVPRHQGAVRAVRRAARDRHRAVVDAGRRRPTTSPAHHYQLADSPALPKPVQSVGHRGGPPVLIGGKGKKQTPALTAALRRRVQPPVRRRGDHRDPVRAGARGLRGDRPRPGRPHLVQRARRCASAATTPRSPAAPTRSAATSTTSAPTRWPAPPHEVIDTIGRYAALGSQRIYLQVLDLADLEHLHLIAEEVMPHV